MRFHILQKTAVILVTMLVCAQSAPTAPPVTPSSPVFSKRDSINDCGDSTFIDGSSSGSPTVADCLQLAANIAGGGTWTEIGSGFKTLATYGTCAFGVQVDVAVAGLFNVGNQDIIDLINSSNELFNWNGLMGASGQMPCQQPLGDPVPVNWAIYHT
ncbi:putative necrosis-inducing factor-domain-containing protein [Lipomyces orientalis]|uniref:Necrosis-inducing factor-domain-containing protein n=1 Tax=Lipomyces orientalis TaxID=1233043 RepID=A0ACC3TJU3_9ASCO